VESFGEFNSSIKGCLVSNDMPNEDRMGLAVDIACTTSQTRIEALHGASLPREFKRQDMAKIFNKQIKHGSQFYLNGHWSFI